ncbi:sodium-coupled monocarboxylate transporter 1-like isoform X2 [Ischnura elegans]|uniref:sodium-coupled monocarboxylate transporter 1-like isoform X2 n=1 Tax=Ischnura elegans TaxID=197161 RepID=UPI001ED89B0C|nr:sodium-coupled monocarboxylate transporter 1-like isoform X2 [Ischnura elegans]
MGDAAEEDVWLAEEGGASSPEATTTFTSEVFDRMAKSTTVGSRFSPVDYAVFCTMLAMSAAIGMYFAFCAKQKQNTTSEYLMGGKKMGIIPVSLSLIASLVSGVTLLGFPAEMYLYGTQFVMFHAGIILAAIPVSLIFVPVYYKLQLTSCYEYLELRFDRKVRLLGSTLYCIFCLLNIPIIIYLPALAFSQVSGFNIHVITPVVCLVCIFYTSLGGMKAVVWTDSLQVIMIFGAMISVICIGTQKVGGVDTVFQRSNDSGRIDFFKIVYIYTFGTAAITLISCYAGLLVYASYYDCDPLTTKAVRAPDQLLPYFVMDLAEYFPGLPGLFIAGVFSAALSTMSTSLNAMSGVIYQSYIKPRFQTPPSEARASCTMKVLCAAIGIFCVLMVFIVEHLGTVAQLSISFGGVTSGPSLSMFVLGMFFPWANAKGAFAGGLTGLLVMGTISFGTQYANARGQIKHPRKPLSTAGCFVDPTEGPVSTLASLVLDSTISLNSTMESPTMGPATVDPPWPIFRISYTLYCMLGMAISLTVGLIVSLLTKPTRPEDLHIDLLSPVIRPYFSQRCRKGPEDERETTSWENGERKGEEFGMDTREVFLKNKDTTDMTKEERKLLKGSR